jgi:hypothetical protein
MMARVKREFNDLLRRLDGVAWGALREEYTPDCCIAACAVLRRVFDYYGHTAEPVPCNVYIFNAVCARLLERCGVPSNAEARRKLYALTGAHSVGITEESEFAGAPVKGGRFGGHLVLRVRDALVDATLKQADRPAHKIMLPDFLTLRNAPRNFAGDRRIELTVNGCWLVYDESNNQKFRHAPDWLRRTTPYPETVRRIIERVEAKCEPLSESQPMSSCVTL